MAARLLEFGSSRVRGAWILRRDLSVEAASEVYMIEGLCGSSKECGASLAPRIPKGSNYPHMKV